LWGLTVDLRDLFRPGGGTPNPSWRCYQDLTCLTSGGCTCGETSPPGMSLSLSKHSAATKPGVDSSVSGRKGGRVGRAAASSLNRPVESGHQLEDPGIRALHALSSLNTNIVSKSPGWAPIGISKSRHGFHDLLTVCSYLTKVYRGSDGAKAIGHRYLASKPVPNMAKVLATSASHSRHAVNLQQSHVLQITPIQCDLKIPHCQKHGLKLSTACHQARFRSFGQFVRTQGQPLGEASVLRRPRQVNWQKTFTDTNLLTERLRHYRE
jgi:hypothetical protein